MPIVLNGTTFSNGGTAKYNNTSLTEIKYGSTTVWKKQVTVTDLVNFKGWTNVAGNNQVAGANTTNETTTVNISTGICFYGAYPSAGLNNGGYIGQNISLVSGHKYYVTYGCFVWATGDPSRGLVASQFRCKVPGSDTIVYGGTNAKEYANIWTSNTTSTFQVYFNSTQYDDAYCRLSYCTVVDLTACFGSGNEPNLSWCNSNIGKALDGSKTVTPA